MRASWPKCLHFCSRGWEAQGESWECWKDLKGAKEAFKCSKETFIFEYKESESLVEDLSSGNVVALDISFNYLYNRVARDFPSADLSQNILQDLVEASMLEGGNSSSSCLNTPNLSSPLSSNAILVTILEDKPLKD